MATPCGQSAALEEAKAGVDSLKEKIKGVNQNKSNTNGQRIALDENGKPKNTKDIFSTHYPEYTKQNDGTYRQTSITLCSARNKQ